MRAAHVRFTPDSDRKSEFPHKVMSALPPKADMCGATMDVRYGPKADIGARPSDNRRRVEVRIRPSPVSGDHWLCRQK
jgi:hypothetical protein